ncbi:MAG: tetratricopeptide repeat protein [Cyanobacteriota bacterium]|nr:tetratricopeptide repeat protein [Cyanobacteriota bacterium]
MRRPRRRALAGFLLALLATTRVRAQAVPKTNDSDGGDPLSAIARHLGLPVGLVLAIGLAWGLLTQADKLRLIWVWGRAWLGKTSGGPSEPTPADPDAEPPTGLALHNLRPPPEDFVARAKPLRRLAAALAPEGSQVVIHGLPGVGKTTLALAYAHRSVDRYPGGRWWLDASEGFEPMVLRAASELEAGIPGLGPAEGLNPEARLRRCLRTWPGLENAAVLLVVDNLPPGREGLELPRRLRTGLPPRFRLLLTQRAEPLDGAAAIDLPVLAPAHALDLLKRRAGERGRRRIAREPEAARRLVADVEGLPLALVLLAGRLRRVSTLSVSELRLELAEPELGAKAFQNAHADLIAERGLVASLLSSWRTLAPEAMELARLLSLTLSAPIPRELIQGCEAPGQRWHDALADLLGANLLDRLAGEPARYALHPLVRQFFAIQRQGWREEALWRQRLAAAASALAQRREAEGGNGAVEAWRQACLADPTQASAFLGLGNGLLRQGDGEGARQALEQALQLAEAAGDERGLALTHCGLGDVRLAQGDGPGALAAYQAALAIAEGLAKRDPANTQWQRDLSVSQEKMGDVLVAQGDGPGALAAYQAALAIREGLAKRDPANTQWQSDLSVSHINMGDVLVAQGDGPAALAAFQAALAIREGLAKRDPANNLWQVDVAISCSRLGTLEGLLDVSTRRAHLQRGLDILLSLKQSGRLHANQDHTAWFEAKIRKLKGAR